MKLSINSIYPGVEGEGVRIGTSQIFVRLQGCRLGCRNCDSKDTWAFSDSSERPLEKIVQNIEILSQKNLFWISITGGDPLDPRHQPGVLALVNTLHTKGFKINLEAAGNTIADDIFHYCDYLSFDYKTPSTGITTDYRLILKMAESYPGKFQIKSVAQDKKDVLQAHQIQQKITRILDTSTLPFPWCLTPSWERSEPFPQKRFQNILEINRHLGAPFRVIGQQHKWFYGPERRDV